MSKHSYKLSIVIPILQMRRARFREPKKTCPSSHILKNRGNLYSNPGLSSSEDCWPESQLSWFTSLLPYNLCRVQCNLPIYLLPRCLWTYHCEFNWAVGCKRFQCPGAHSVKEFITTSSPFTRKRELWCPWPLFCLLPGWCSWMCPLPPVFLLFFHLNSCVFIANLLSDHPDCFPFSSSLPGSGNPSGQGQGGA